jgi:hypothetical protein
LLRYGEQSCIWRTGKDLGGVALGVATVTIATVAAVTTGTAPGTAAAPTVTITPGIPHQQREPRTSPSTTWLAWRVAKKAPIRAQKGDLSLRMVVSSLFVTMPSA